MRTKATACGHRRPGCDYKSQKSESLRMFLILPILPKNRPARRGLAGPWPRSAGKMGFGVGLGGRGSARGGYGRLRASEDPSVRRSEPPGQRPVHLPPQESHNKRNNWKTDGRAPQSTHLARPDWSWLSSASIGRRGRNSDERRKDLIQVCGGQSSPVVAGLGFLVFLTAFLAFLTFMVFLTVGFLALFLAFSGAGDLSWGSMGSGLHYSFFDLTPLGSESGNRQYTGRRVGCVRPQYPAFGQQSE